MSEFALPEKVGVSRSGKPTSASVGICTNSEAAGAEEDSPQSKASSALNPIGDCSLQCSIDHKSALRPTIQPATNVVGRTLPGQALFHQSTRLTSAPPLRGAFSLPRSKVANVGQDKDSQRRQAEAVEGYAEGRHAVVQSFYDAAVSGADPVATRPGFGDVLAYCELNGVSVVLVENASRFARDLAVQLTGHALLRARGIELIPADAPTYFTDPSPTAEMVRQILGAVAVKFEKAGLVAKLKGARERKRAATGRCEGRKAVPEPRLAVSRGSRPRLASAAAFAPSRPSWPS